VIKGLDEGILSMKIGGKRRLYIPGSVRLALDAWYSKILIPVFSVSLECFWCSSWIKWCSINNGNVHSYSPNLAFLWHWSIMQIQETSISFLLLFWWINMRKKNLTYRCFFFPLISWHSRKVSLQLQEGQECLQIVQLFSM